MLLYDSAVIYEHSFPAMNKMKKNRREFLKTGAAGLATIALFRNAKGELIMMNDGGPFPELVEVTISDLQAGMKARKC